jgi:phosphatidylglycerophosphatase A
MLIASSFYLGYLPASGTWGSLVVPALYYLIPRQAFPLFVIVAAPVVLLLGVLAARRAEQLWCEDSGRIVIDEVDGMLVTLLFLPVNGITIWIGFLLFRLFDILKPPPVNLAERLGGGWGVMLDDVLAGVYANIALRVILYFIPGWGY